MNRTLGIVLMIIGVVMLIWTGFNYTKKEKVLDAGPLQLSVNKKKTVSWPPYVGAVLFVGGLVITLTSKKSR